MIWDDDPPTDVQTLIQEAQWSTLYGFLRGYFRKFGTENAFGEGDFFVVDDNYGYNEQRVYFFNLDLLTIESILAVHLFIQDFPTWSVVFAIDVLEQEGKWPDMGLRIRKNEIIDGLQRDYLPERFHDFTIPGSRAGSPND